MQNTNNIAKFVAKAIDEIEESFADQPNCVLGEVMLIVEVKDIDMTVVDDDVPEGEMGTAIKYSCTDERFWVHQGLLNAALDTV